MSRLGRFGCIAFAALLGPASAAGQGLGFRADGLLPTGGLTSVTESWGVLRLTITNFDPAPKAVRVVVFYPAAPEVQFGRQINVPAESRLTTELPVGPAPTQSSAIGRDIQFMLYERDGDDWRPLPALADERLRSRRLPYRKREPTTAILLDPEPDRPRGPEPDSPAGQALTLARTFRAARGLSEALTVMVDRPLPAAPEAFAGTDQVILAGNQLADDPPAARALRQWVEQGGTLWVLLDLVDPAALATVLGDDLDFTVVGRTSLTTVRLTSPADPLAADPPRSFDTPVPFVRVALGGRETTLYEADGWPAAFVQPVGRGQVVVTTLGGTAWHRPRTPRDPKSSFEHAPDLPVAVGPLRRLAVALYPEPRPDTFGPDDLTPLVTAGIGYSVLGRGTVALVLGGFAVGLLGVGLAARRARRPGLAGWLALGVSVVAAGLLVALAVARREAVPPTAGVVAVLDAAPGSEEASAVGLIAVYRPDSGPVELTALHGGRLDPDRAGLEGQTRRRIQTDIDTWHWEGLALPAGVRVGQFRAVVPTGPVRAVARFGPDGVVGHLAAGRLRDPADAVLLTAARTPTGVRLAADGTLASGPADALPAGQFLSGAVLTDTQRRRQEGYRKLLAPPLPAHLDGRDLLLAWADATDLPFTAGGTERTVGSYLLVTPIKWARPTPAERVTIPAGFIPYTAVLLGRPVRPTLDGARPTDMRLRFQLPPSALPMTVERATLRVRVQASGRTFRVVGYAGGETIPLAQVNSPIDPVRVDVTDPRLLVPDADGFLYLGVAVSERAGAGDDRQAALDEKWRIEGLTLEVVGRAGR